MTTAAPPSGRYPRAIAGVLAVALAQTASAFTYLLPDSGDNVVGEPQTVIAVHSDTFSDLGLRFNQGYREMKAANPHADPWLPGEGTPVLVPSHYVLPDAPRHGIVVNVPEMRLYFYPKPKAGERAVVITHPISVGRQDWRTPKTETRVVAKTRDPAWYPPESIRKEHAENGDPLARVVPPGPDNPLGRYALRLGLSGYLIHGTNRVYGIGMRVTHGCIRMYPDDIARLFPQVPVGTSVRIVDQPFKVGLSGEQIFLEVHPHLEEGEADAADQYRRIVDRIIVLAGERRTSINWNALQAVVSERRGIPLPVGRVEATAPQAALSSVH
ncbi:MAG: L,D-transpeptidase family protein [Gammaproteobacteria bacterium]|nr:L,D-transpeptidase family protein [Gammaproteobacteria bacterium]